MYNIVAIFGRSGSGKDTILNKILSSKYKDKFHRIIRYTTRPKRKNEVDGIDYFFISPKEMIDKIMSGEAIEANAFGDKGWVYGTTYNSLKEDKINIGVYDIEAVEVLMEDKETNVFPIFIDKNEKNCLIRSIWREEDPDYNEIFRRFKSEREMYLDRDYIYGDLAWRAVDNNDTSTTSTTIANLVEDIIEEII